MENSKVILVLGGNGFIGSCFVEYILNKNENYDLVLLNRNNWTEWDHSIKIKPRIKENIYWDRKNDSIRKCLKYYLTNENFKFEAIIDFSAYKLKDIKNVIDKLSHDRFKYYFLISTDSVYEVCQANNKNAMLETDSIRPESEDLRKHMKKLDSYGHHKLKCEEYLREEAKNSQFSYVILRLPDVIGEKDSTERFWLLQMYLQYLEFTGCMQHDILISKSYFNKQTSYVYVQDVACVIYNILKANEIKNEIFNVSFNETLSINQLYDLLASIINNDLKLNYILVDSELDHPFPSVNRSININKIKSTLSFESTFLREAFQKTIEFYNEAYTKFPRERKAIEKCLRKNLLKDCDEILFKNFIEIKTNSKTNQTSLE